MNPNLQRALLLFEQQRPELAEEHFRLAIADEPQNGHAFASFSLCLAANKKLTEAEQAARQAVHLAPDESYSHYALAWTFDDQDRHRDAEIAVREAIRLDHSNPSYWSLLASTLAQQQRWAEALWAAEQGLTVDPTHPGCSNMRALGLQFTGRRQDAVATTDASLARDPENPATHYAGGLALLEGGDRKAALHHFRECLRLDPAFEPAREGIVEALRSANPAYRVFLRFSFWLARKGSKWGWVITIGAFVLVRIVRSIAESNAELAPFLWPIVYLYLAFVLLSWLGGPLHDLVLLLHPLGRIALSRDARRAALMLGALLVVGLPPALVGALLGDMYLVAAGGACVALAIPAVGMFRLAATWARVLIGIVFGGLTLILLTTVPTYLAGDTDLALAVAVLVIAGCALSTWLALGLSLAKGRRRI